MYRLNDSTVKMSVNPVTAFTEEILDAEDFDGLSDEMKDLVEDGTLDLEDAKLIDL